MKLWLISQTVNTGWDTYSDAVVAAKSVGEARQISPDRFREWDETENSWMFTYSDGRRERDSNGTWADRLDDITVEYLGQAKRGTKKGVVCASFHAG